MHTKAALMNYEKLAFSITTTAPVEDWREMLKQVKELNEISGQSYSCAWPLSGIVGCIRKMLEDLDKTHADVLIKDDPAQASD